MFGFQMQALIEELQDARYDGMSAAQVYGVLMLEARYHALQQTTFLTRQELYRRQRLGTLTHPYRVITEQEAIQCPGGETAMPIRLEWDICERAWRLARRQS